MEITEQVNETAIQETTSETVEEVKQETVADEYIAPSKEQFEKELQKAKSNAKFEILKELGITSVKDFKEAQKQKDDAFNAWNTEKEELTKKVSTYENDISALKEETALLKAGVDENYKEDALTLARTKVGQDKDLATALDEVLSKNPNWRTGSREPLRMGTEKHEAHKPLSLEEQFAQELIH